VSSSGELPVGTATFRARRQLRVQPAVGCAVEPILGAV